MIFQEDLYRIFLAKLMGTPGPTGEEEPRRKVIEAFLDHEKIPFSVDSAGNLEVIVEGRAEEAPLILDAHMDVVGAGCGSLSMDGEKWIGPGVADNLAAVTLLLLLAGKIHKKRNLLNRPLHLLFSTGEEGEGNLSGIHHYIKRQKRRPFAFLCLDLDMGVYALSAVGSTRYRVLVEGEGGHSWGDWGVKNAISVLAGFLLEAEKLADAPGTPIHERLSFNIGSFSGGEGINLISRHAEACFEFRSTDPFRLSEVEKRLGSLQKSVLPPIILECIGRRPASKAVHSEFLEKAVLDAASMEKMTILENPISSNANATLAAGWPSVTFGICRCGNIHRKDEFLERKSLVPGARFLWQVLENIGLF